MVWGLFPVNPLPGEHQFYIFRKGTYKVGRKGCDIIVVKDKGVSRIHAEILIDEMVCMDSLHKKSSKSSSEVRIRDCSKYGTFIDNNLGSKVKVHEFPNKETVLNDGDVVSFGTGNANYRFRFVPFVFFLCSSTDPLWRSRLEDLIALIGASAIRSWSLQCTHVAIDDFMSVNNDIIDSIVAKKPIIGYSWFELIAGKTICTEIPSFQSHTPTLTLGGVRFKVCDAESREHCLEGYTFLLESTNKYLFRNNKLQLILEAGGAKVIFETPRSSNPSLENHLVCVVPAGMTSITKINSLRKVNETELISAVVSGHLDPSIIITSAPVLVTSSCSTDETVVADSDVEMETAISIDKSVVVSLVESPEDEYEEEMVIHKAKYVEKDSGAVHIFESTEQDNRVNTAALQSDHMYSSPVKSDANISLSIDRVDGFVAQKNLDHASESDNVDIIYSQNLIVRDPNLSQSGRSSMDDSSVNFKRFRKTSAPSGNSFNNLIPFSKYPYIESDYGNECVAESVKEEKKRKQIEAISEDLFNNEKGRKRGAVGQLHGLFARG